MWTKIFIILIGLGTGTLATILLTQSTELYAPILGSITLVMGILTAFVVKSDVKRRMNALLGLTAFIGGIMTTAVFILSPYLYTTNLSMMALIVGSLWYLIVSLEARRRQLEQRRRIQDTYDQLDQQAKLIIRTDMELHRTQEELDQRLASLISLHQLRQQLDVSLQPDEVYGKLTPDILTNLGFSKGLLGVCLSPGSLEWRSLIGLSRKEAEALRLHLTQGPLLKQILANPAPTFFTSGSTTEPLYRKLVALLGTSTVVIAAVTPHAGSPGCLLLGRAGTGHSGRKGDEELLGILTNQLTTAVENSKLFEEAWTAQQVLERKVRQRTHELAQANAKLVRLNNAKSDFVSAVSHELRTPLAAIKGYASLLAIGQFGELTKPQRERIVKVEKHTDGLTHLINDMLDIARIESGRTSMEHQVIALDEFVANLYDLVHPQLDEKHLHYDVDRNGVNQISGDPQQLQRVFVNLLSNAIKYTPERGKIHVAFRRDGPSIIATVQDTGHGIGPDDLPKLFQEFYRADDPINQEVRGTGLGLALVKRIVEAHHAEISVSSKIGQGSTFTIRLPAP